MGKIITISDSLCQCLYEKLSVLKIFETLYIFSQTLYSWYSMDVLQKVQIRAYLGHEVKVRQIVGYMLILATQFLQGILLQLHPNVRKSYLKITKLLFLLLFGNNNYSSYCSIYMAILLGWLKFFHIYKET